MTLELEEQIEKMIRRAMYGFPWEQYKYGPRLYCDLAELMREREKVAKEEGYEHGYVCGVLAIKKEQPK